LKFGMVIKPFLARKVINAIIKSFIK